MATSIPELVAVEPLGPNQFASRHNPVRMGNAAHIAYGGSTLAFAVNAAASTVAVETFRIYSVLGHYLSGAKADRRLHATVTSLRDTTSFVTRSVLVSQVLDTGVSRNVMMTTIDFQRIEPGSLLTYSVAPPKLASPILRSWEEAEALERLKKIPGQSDGAIRMYKKTFEPHFRFFEQRSCPESITAQNMNGIIKKAATSQDHLPLVEKTSFDWLRSRTPLAGYSEHMSSLAFVMDEAISFIPLTHSHMFLQDAAACSSLDFALRIFDNDVDFNQWHLREMKTAVGSAGRTYSTSRLFDQSGKLVLEMSQQSILRPHREKKASL